MYYREFTYRSCPESEVVQIGSSSLPSKYVVSGSALRSFMSFPSKIRKVLLIYVIEVLVLLRLEQLG